MFRTDGARERREDAARRITAQIFACSGTVETYIGDAVFAVFGLPNAGPDDAANALRCAELMISMVAEWNSERSWEGESPLAIGIGLNYCPAVIGDVGSEQGLSFTVIGDTSTPLTDCRR